MRIEIDIDDPKLWVTLSRWASVGRTFDVIRRALEDPDDEDAWVIAMDELEEIGPALNRLHKTVQTEMWKNMCGRVLREMGGYTNDIICRLPKDHGDRCRGT